MLSDCIANRTDELQADFAQYYNVMDVISRLERGELSPRFVAALCAQLPPQARIFVADDPDAAWGIADAILVSVDYDLRALLYSLGGGKGPKPKPIHKFGKGKAATARHDDPDGELELVSIPDLQTLALRLTAGGEEADGDGERAGIGVDLDLPEVQQGLQQ